MIEVTCGKIIIVITNVIVGLIKKWFLTDYDL